MNTYYKEEVVSYGDSTYISIELNNTITIEKYQIEMLKQNYIKQLLQIDIECINGSNKILYNISSLTLLQNTINNKKLNYNIINGILDTVFMSVSNARKYLLNINNLIIDIDKVYVDNDKNKIELFLLYLPIRESYLSCKKQIVKLIDELIYLIDKKDEEAAHILHVLKIIGEKENFTIQELIDVKNNYLTDDKKIFKKHLNIGGLK
jgi:hypothetical protein